MNGCNKMSIINLSSRITSDMNDYEDNKKSAKSLIYVNEEVSHDICSEETLILTVGDSYMKNSQLIKIPDKGLVVKPSESVLIRTKQKIATPLNVVGIVYGMGSNIFNGGFISTGKIDQGFYDYLKIGYYNGSKHNVIFSEGDVLACAIFHSTENTMKAAKTEKAYDRIPNYSVKRTDKIIEFMGNNWISLLSLFVAAITLFLRIYEVKL